MPDLKAAAEEMREIVDGSWSGRESRDACLLAAQALEALAWQAEVGAWPASRSPKSKERKMTRDEVLDAVNWAAEVFDELVANCTDDNGRAKWDGRATALRAAAELIRAGGWRPIAEAPSVIPPSRLGWWGTEKWYEVVTQYPIPKLNASTLGYTHYCPLDKPEPPAREVENG